MYCAILAETGLREVMSDIRPSPATRRRFIAKYGPEAARELPPETIDEQWRRKSVLVPVRIALDAGFEILDVTERYRIEERHSALLEEHGMQHLDISQVTARRRTLTQQIATTAYDDGVGVIRYPSSLDGNPCYALFEGRARLVALAEPIPLTDPAPAPLVAVAAGWRLQLTPVPTLDPTAGT